MSTVEAYLRFRFDYASLLWDSLRGFFRHQPAYGARIRIASALIFLVLLAPPVITLIVGDTYFGNGYAFPLTILIWPVFLEAPSWLLRQGQAWPGTAHAPGSQFDTFLHVAFGVVAVLAIAALWYFDDDLTDVVQRGNVSDIGWIGVAMLWGVALSGGADLARSIVAFGMARLHGFPLYPPPL
jgi:hypothetical protein